MSLQFFLSKKNEHTRIELLLVNRLASPVYKNLKITRWSCDLWNCGFSWLQFILNICALWNGLHYRLNYIEHYLLSWTSFRRMQTQGNWNRPTTTAKYHRASSSIGSSSRWSCGEWLRNLPLWRTLKSSCAPKSLPWKDLAIIFISPAMLGRGGVGGVLRGELGSLPLDVQYWGSLKLVDGTSCR